ncbi:MAG: universal stress protein [Dermatophilaceae bacterium]
MTLTAVGVTGRGTRRAIVAGVILPDEADVQVRRGTRVNATARASSQAGVTAITAAVLASHAVVWAVDRATQSGQVLTVAVVAPLRPDAAVLPVDTACAAAYIADGVCARRPGLNAVVEILYGDPVAHLALVSEDADLIVLDATGDGRSDAVVARSRCPVTVVPADGVLEVDATAPVVVGIKDLAGSAHLLRFAALEAVRAERPLDVLHLWTYPGPRVYDEAMAILGSEKERLLAKAVDPIADALPGLQVTSVVTLGRAEHALVEASHSAALVVLGSREDRWRSPRLLGPTRRGILDGATCPAVTVPDAPAMAHV